MNSSRNNPIHLLKKHEAARTILLIAVLVGGSYGGWTYLKFFLHTQYPILVVVSGSMIPTLNVGDLILIKGQHPASIMVGTIIIFHSPRDFDTLIVHRVIEKIDNGGTFFFRTKGDNNPVSDSWDPLPGVPQDYLVGVYVARIPYLGVIVMKMREPAGMAIIALLIAAIVILELVESRAKTRENEKRHHDQEQS